MTDYLIVGQGIAGSILAWELIQKGYSVKIIDLTSGAPSSRQAAGLINPITGRRFVKSWMIDELLPSAIATYSSIAESLNIDFFEVTKGIRPISNVEQLNDIEVKFVNNDYKYYLKSNVSVYNTFEINNPLGCVDIYGLLHINVVDMLDALSSFFREQDVLQTGDFNIDNLNIGKKSVQYGNLEALQIIFCEGFQLINNKWFKELPLRPVKGEIFIIECPELKLKYPIVGPTFLIPQGNHRFYVGSTYDWKDRSLKATPAKRDELVNKLKDLLLLPFKIVEHKVGIRPATIDRRPLIGRHPENRNLILFNGLGTKGLSIAPFFAKHLINHIESGEALNKEVDIARFAKG